MSGAASLFELFRTLATDNPALMIVCGVIVFLGSLHTVAWLINALTEEVTKCIRGYEPPEPHCHACAVDVRKSYEEEGPE